MLSLSPSSLKLLPSSLAAATPRSRTSSPTAPSNRSGRIAAHVSALNLAPYCRRRRCPGLAVAVVVAVRSPPCPAAADAVAVALASRSPSCCHHPSPSLLPSAAPHRTRSSLSPPFATHPNPSSCVLPSPLPRPFPSDSRLKPPERIQTQRPQARPRPPPPPPTPPTPQPPTAAVVAAPVVAEAVAAVPRRSPSIQSSIDHREPRPFSPTLQSFLRPPPDHPFRRSAGVPAYLSADW